MYTQLSILQSKKIGGRRGKMRVIHRVWILCVCLVLLCCVAGTGAQADAGDLSRAVDREKDVVQNVPEDQRIVFEAMCCTASMGTCCTVTVGTLVNAEKWLLFGNEKDIVQDVPEDQRVVFEELMEFLGIAPPYFLTRYQTPCYFYDVELIYPTDWEDWALIGDRYIYLNELLSAFPNYKAIRFYPQLQFPAYYMDVYLNSEWYNYWCNRNDRYIAYDCTDGSTVFCKINTAEGWVEYATWIRSRCTPEEFQAVQVGMSHREVGRIDPNTDLGQTGSSGATTSWHLLSDDTMVRITYEFDYVDDEDYDYKICAIDYYSSYEAAFQNGLVEKSTFGWLNPADLPD